MIPLTINLFFLPDSVGFLELLAVDYQDNPVFLHLTKLHGFAHTILLWISFSLVHPCLFNDLITSTGVLRTVYTSGNAFRESNFFAHQG